MRSYTLSMHGGSIKAKTSFRTVSQDASRIRVPGLRGLGFGFRFEV